MPAKLRGGPRQQLAQARAQEEAAEPAPQDSHLAKMLIEKWAWGGLSTPDLQKLASAAFKDGLHHPQVRALAALGAWGKYPANMQRDLLQAVGADCKLKFATCHFKVSLLGPKGVGLPTDVTMILPHKLFSMLYHHRPAAFQSSVLGGGPGNIRAFWRAMKDHPLVQSNPALRAREDLFKVVPLGIHGDGVNYQQIKAGSKSLEVLSWSSLLSKAPTKVDCFLIFLIVKSVVTVSGFMKTWPRVYKVLIWSLEALACGTWPTLDWEGRAWEDATSNDFIKQGQPLAEGYCGLLFVLRSDLDFLANHYGLNHPSSNNPCVLCRADRTMGSAPWTDCRSSASWRATIWTSEGWLASHADCHPLLKMPGGGICLVYPDLMHVKHLGTDLILLGSVLAWLLHHYLPGSTAENLEFVWEFIKGWYKDAGQEAQTHLSQECSLKGDSLALDFCLLTGPRMSTGFKPPSLPERTIVVMARRSSPTSRNRWSSLSHSQSSQ